MTSSRSTEQAWLRSHEVCGVAENNLRRLNAETGEALLVTTEDLARLILQTEWSSSDRAQLRDLARHTLDIINSIGAR